MLCCGVQWVRRYLHLHQSAALETARQTVRLCLCAAAAGADAGPTQSAAQSRAASAVGRQRARARNSKAAQRKEKTCRLHVPKSVVCIGLCVDCVVRCVCVCVVVWCLKLCFVLCVGWWCSAFDLSEYSARLLEFLNSSEKSLSLRAVDVAAHRLQLKTLAGLYGLRVTNRGMRCCCVAAVCTCSK